MSAAGRPFVGRLDAVDALRRRRDAAVSGQGGLTLLEGDAGVGKSTLLLGVETEASEKGMHLLVGRAPSLENPPPYLLLRRALESAVTPPSGDSGPPGGSPLAFAAPGPTKLPLLGFAPRADRGRWSDTAQVQERLLDQLGESGAALPIGRGHTAGPILERLLALADRGPTLLVLDDLHLADEPSLDALLELAPRLSRHGLWILATTLPFTGLPEARRHVLEQIARAAGAERIAVDPLTAAEVAEFVQQIDPARSVDSSDLIWWHSQSGGNPSFLAQILRRQEPTGAAGAVPPARGPSVSAAPEFAEYLARQVGELSEAERRTLTVAAVIGREFPFALLLRATGEDEEALTEIVQSLVHHGILQENAAEQVGFVRDDLRGQIDEGLTEAHRRVLHRRTGEALEALGVADEATVYALARHYYLGKVDAKAVEYNRMAGELAARALAPMVARTHFERALECQRRLTPRAPLAELALILDLAIQLDRLGELRSAEKFVRTALTEIGSLVGVPAGEKVLLTVYLARILADEGEWDEADRLTAALLEGPDVPTSPLTLLTIHRLRGELFYFRGEYDASLRHHDAALSYARAQRNEREVAREMVRRANVLGMIPGRLDEAIEAYHIASRTLRNLGDRAEASYALLYLGVVLAQHGRLAESLAQLESAATLAEEVQEPRRLGWALFNAADVRRELGELEPARTANRKAREILERVGDRFGLLQTYIVEGKILLSLDDLAGAEVELLEAYRLVRELRTPADELEVILRLAELSDRRGEFSAVKSRVAELRRGKVAQLRPDLVPDFERLAARLEGPGGERRVQGP